jgi:LacI family transcriptional regulator
MSITLQDIANHAGVSNATVSRVINNPTSVAPKTRKNVLSVIKKFNYVPNAVARSLSRNETNIIGIIVPDITNPFFGKIIRGINTILREMDYNIAMCDTEENILNEDASLQMLRKQHVRGLIFTPTIEEEKTNGLKLLEIEQSGIPVVVVDRGINFSNFDGVFLDNVKAGLDATQSFINAGHKKIAAILGPADSKASMERALGYRRSLDMNKIHVDPRYILNGSYDMECGYEMTKKLLELDEPPTAIFIGSSILSKACINALLDSNLKIPQDMAIIGFDEIPYMKSFGIDISYIDRSVREMGEFAAKLLIDKIKNSQQGEHVCKRIIISPKLVLNGSELYFNK